MAVTSGLDEAGHLSVADRRRVGLIEDDLPPRAYHAAAPLGPAEAEALVARVDASIAARARAVVNEILAAAGDVSIVGVAVVGEPREFPDVDLVLVSHARMHACEGEQYRRGIVEAANDLGLPALRIGPTELTSVVTEILDWTPERTRSELAAVRAEIGSPWRNDHRQAALAARVALHR